MDRFRPTRAWIGAAPLLVVLLGCGGTDRGTASFCEQLAEQLPGLEGPVATQLEIDALVERYRDLERYAPLAIEPSWDQLVVMVETAATVEPDDAESLQRAADVAYESEQAARDIAEWAKTNCDLDLPAIGGVGTPGTLAPATTTTTTTTIPPAAPPTTT